VLIHSWNVQAGGGTRVDKIVDVITRHAADTVVLGETTAGRLDDLLAGLAKLGYKWIAAPRPAGNARGVMIASKIEFEQRSPSAARRVPDHRWCEVWFPRRRLGLAGLYFPDTAKPIAEFWPRVLEAADRRRDDSFVLVGDLNSGQSVLDSEGRELRSDPWFTAMPFHGMIDLWRHTNRDQREYTWYSNHRGRRNGFRIDHAFGTRSVRRRLRRAWYSHEERMGAVSDHSSLLVDLR
jgi:exonuclease III